MKPNSRNPGSGFRWPLVCMFLGLLLLNTGCYNDKPDFCLQDGVKYWGCHAAILELAKPPCPPPLLTLQPGLQTLNTGGGNRSPYFRFPQVNGLKSYRITVNEKTGQNIWTIVGMCGNSIDYTGSSSKGQTENFDVAGDNYNIYKYYSFYFIDAGGNYEIQFTIPSAPL